jgi:hypothetical protein
MPKNIDNSNEMKNKIGKKITSKKAKSSKGSKKSKQTAGSYVGHNPIITKKDNEHEKCAPGKKFEQGSCFTIDQLLDMANAYNNMILLKLIESTLGPIKISNSKIELLKQLNDRLKDKCGDNNQICWIKQSFIQRTLKKDDIINNTIRPSGPQGRFTWLSTSNIDNVMKQYHERYPDFKFMGTVPLDFDSFPQLGFINIKLDKMVKDGITKLGAVFNLDYHYQSGSHWVAMYSDLKHGKIYYFDSYGKPPELEIKKFVKRITKWYVKKHEKNNIEIDDTETFMCQKEKNNIEKNSLMDIRYGTLRHQYKNSECGVYSMNFILRLLKGETFDEINGSRLSDDKVNECREVYFTYT